MLLTNCVVTLIGSLSTMPIALNEEDNEMIIVVTRQRYCFMSNEIKRENYRVILNDRDAKRVMLMGYPGISLSVQGDLCFEDKLEIIAEKIDFIDFPRNNQQQPSFIFNYKDADTELQCPINLEMYKLFQNATIAPGERLH